jgi:hypothetical protein
LETKRRNWLEDLALKGSKIARDKLRESLNNYEREIEQEFFFASQTIVPIANQEERYLFLFKQGKRFEKNCTDILNAAVNRLKQLEQEKIGKNKFWHKFQLDVIGHKISAENTKEKDAKDCLRRIHDALSKIKVANPDAKGYDELSRYYDQN